MNDLISRSALIETLEEYIEYDTFDLHEEEPQINLGFEQLEDIICSQPTVEAKPVVHGEWIENYYDYKCSQCNTVFDDDLAWTTGEYKIPKFCPECGADMRKKVE